MTATARAEAIRLRLEPCLPFGFQRGEDQCLEGAVNDDDTIGEIASLVGRTPAQVTLRWHVQRGDIVFPKSMHQERMRENFAIFDFELSGEDLATISDLDRGESGRTGPNPNTFDMIR